jgi:hypothetical protein
MRALPGERRILQDNSTPDPAKPAGLLGPRVVGAVGALAGPGTEHRHCSLQDFFKFQGVGSGSGDHLNHSSLGEGAQRRQH